MNRIFKISILLLLLSVFYSCNEVVKDGVYKIDIYATNDLHGRLFDTLYTQKGNLNEAMVHPYSLSSVSAYMKKVKREAGETGIVLIDTGDHLQGDNSVFYYNFIDTVDKHIFARVMNYLNYDAVVVGNHDIEAGPGVYNKIQKEMNAPYLAANAVDIKSGRPYFKPYTIVKRGGVRVAIIGITNPNIPKWLSPRLWRGMRFEDIDQSLRYWVDYVSNKEKPHLVVAALHAGLGTPDEYTPENPARYIAANIEGIDIVFAAHDHRTTAEIVYNSNRPVWVLEGGSRASALSYASVEMEFKNGIPVSKSIFGSVIPMNDQEPDSEYNNFFKNEYNKIKEFTNRYVGTLNYDITTRDAYFGPSAYIDMIHRLQLESSGAEISFVAPLSFDVTIKAGELNFQDLLNIYPYENQLYIVELTGQEVKNYLEYSYSKWVNTIRDKSQLMLQINMAGKGERSRFNNVFFNFDSAAGILYEVDVTQSAGNRITILSDINNNPFELDRRYRVALTSYRANGGGDLLEMGAGIAKEELESRVIDRLSDIRELLYKKIKSDGSISPVKLNQWKFVPENLVSRAAVKEYKLLFGED